MAQSTVVREKLLQQIVNLRLRAIQIDIANEELTYKDAVRFLLEDVEVAKVREYTFDQLQEYYQELLQALI